MTDNGNNGVVPYLNTIDLDPEDWTEVSDNSGMKDVNPEDGRSSNRNHSTNPDVEDAETVQQTRRRGNDDARQARRDERRNGNNQHNASTTNQHERPSQGTSGLTKLVAVALVFAFLGGLTWWSNSGSGSMWSWLPFVDDGIVDGIDTTTGAPTEWVYPFTKETYTVADLPACNGAKYRGTVSVTDPTGKTEQFQTCSVFGKEKVLVLGRPNAEMLKAYYVSQGVACPDQKTLGPGVYCLLAQPTGVVPRTVMTIEHVEDKCTDFEGIDPNVNAFTVTPKFNGRRIEFISNTNQPAAVYVTQTTGLCS